MNVGGCLIFVLHLFLTSQLGASASCQETVYLERGVTGMIDCFYEDYQLITWSTTGNTNSLIVFQNDARSGSGFDSGEYDLLLNGSLIIMNVSQQHERQYSLWVLTKEGQELSSDVTVRIFVRPIPGYPVINGMTNRQNLFLRVGRLWIMGCSMENVRPAITLEWVIGDGSPPNNLVINNDTTTRDHVDGTSSIHLQSHFKMSDTSVRSLIILCVVIGPDVLSSTTSVDVLFPAVSNDSSIDPVSTAPVLVIDSGYSEHLNYMGKLHRQIQALLAFMIIVMLMLAFLVCLVIYNSKLLIRRRQYMKVSARGGETPESNETMAMGIAQRSSVEIQTVSNRPHDSTPANR